MYTTIDITYTPTSIPLSISNVITSKSTKLNYTIESLLELLNTNQKQNKLTEIYCIKNKLIYAFFTIQNEYSKNNFKKLVIGVKYFHNLGYNVYYHIN